ncbi:hypothetical protein DWC20_16000 [Clostridium botulinum]|nr:hypothetical protein [Clostridium botulinum]
MEEIFYISSIIYKNKIVQIKNLGVDIVRIMLTIFFILIFVISYYKTNKYLAFAKEFINIEEIDFQKLNVEKYEILFCTKEQLQKSCKLIFKFYFDNKCDYSIKKLKLLCDEKSFNNKKCVEFFMKHEIDYFPNMSFLENGKKINSIILTYEV